jgi:vacuolar-type H+-ATPase subunit E/Vma4
LIESLRRAGDEKIRLVKQEAEREAESLRACLGARLEDLRKRQAGEFAVVAAEAERRAFADAGNRARSLRLDAEQALAGRLLCIAQASLSRLREGAYAAVFEKLALELPSLPWKLVRVNPADVDLARGYFPDAELVANESITGGMDAATGDGALRVINTFEKRLERAWGELLPVLMKDVLREASDGASPGSR